MSPEERARMWRTLRPAAIASVILIAVGALLFSAGRASVKPKPAHPCPQPSFHHAVPR